MISPVQNRIPQFAAAVPVCKDRAIQEILTAQLLQSVVQISTVAENLTASFWADSFPSPALTQPVQRIMSASIPIPQIFRFISSPL